MNAKAKLHFPGIGALAIGVLLDGIVSSSVATASTGAVVDVVLGVLGLTCVVSLVAVVAYVLLVVIRGDTLTLKEASVSMLRAFLKGKVEWKASDEHADRMLMQWRSCFFRYRLKWWFVVECILTFAVAVLKVRSFISCV